MRGYTFCEGLRTSLVMLLFSVNQLIVIISLLAATQFSFCKGVAINCKAIETGVRFELTFSLVDNSSLY